jgi:probable HAF family extracellular repeat protein
MLRPIGVLAGLCLVGAFTALPAQGATTQLRPIPGSYLPSAGASSSAALAISASGLIAGTADGSPVVWRDGRLRHLPYPDGAVPAGASGILGEATAAERSATGDDLVAGDVTFQTTAGVSSSAVMVWRAGQPRLLQGQALARVLDLNAAGDALVVNGLPRLGQTFTVQHADGSVITVPFTAVALDSAGRPAGVQYEIGAGVFAAHAVRLDGGTTTVLDTPAGLSSAVNDVAPDGTMCGETFTLSLSSTGSSPVRLQRQAVLWQADGTRVPLSAPGTESWCTKIANGRVAAGQFISAGGSTGAVLWRDGTASAVGPAHLTTEVTGVNRSGQVIGTGYSAEEHLGFVARANGWHELVVRGAESTRPRAINAVGTVVGTATTAAGTQRAAVWSAG